MQHIVTTSNEFQYTPCLKKVPFYFFFNNSVTADINNFWHIAFQGTWYQSVANLAYKLLPHYPRKCKIVILSNVQQLIKQLQYAQSKLVKVLVYRVMINTTEIFLGCTKYESWYTNSHTEMFRQ